MKWTKRNYRDFSVSMGIIGFVCSLIILIVVTQNPVLLGVGAAGVVLFSSVTLYGAWLMRETYLEDIEKTKDEVRSFISSLMPTNNRQDIKIESGRCNVQRIGTNAGRLYDHKDTSYYRSHASRRGII